MISNMGFNEGFITLYVAEGAETGSVVTVTDNNTCGECEADQKFCGVLKGKRNNVGSVQVKGYVKLTYSGATPSLGATYLVADGNGGVKESTNGIAVIVTDFDEAASTIEAIM